MKQTQTTLYQAKELESYFKFRIEYLAKQYPNDFELGSEVRKLTN